MADRRRFLKTTLQGGIALGTSLGLAAAHPARTHGALLDPGQTGPDQTPLPYPADALEPVIDARTMDIHYTKHAATYAKNLKDALAAEKLAPDTTLERLLPTISRHSEKMRNNAGGHYNHELFWRCMTPHGPQEPAGALLQAIQSDIGPLATFRQRFSEAAMTRFGSGWAWLYRDPQGKLRIGSTPNQDNPLMDLSPLRGTPLLGLDVWEHAYYLKYQNRRAEYVENWFKLVNWTFVAQRYEASA
jgi:Fe-Mn family superoxide dismutase